MAGFAMVLGALYLLSAVQVGAVPRYSARYEQNCELCHVNPSGGGMRSAYAAQELVPREIAMSPGTPAALAEIDPRLGKRVGFGVDFRHVFLAETADAPLAAPQGFFQMQADFYLSFQLDPRLLVYYDRGQGVASEVFGLLHGLPLDGFVKAGRFVPSYGLKFDDHTMFVRDEQGFAPPANNDTGVELGFSPGNTDVQIGVLNGARGSALDNDRRLALTLNANQRFRLGPLAASFGVSGYSRPGLQEDLITGGLYGSLNGWNVTWLGQSDWMRRETPAGARTSGVVTSQELALMLRQGIELKGTYDFHDPNRYLRTGFKSRWGGGVQVMPRSFVVVEAMYRHTRVQSGPALTATNYDEGVFQLHLLY